MCEGKRLRYGWARAAGTLAGGVGLAGVAWLANSGVAVAHGGAEVSGRFPEALGEWSLEPFGFLVVGELAVTYGWWYWRLRRDPRPFRFPRWHVAAFATGLVVLLLALVSPIDSYGDDLFWVHMVQHMLMVMVVAPLLLLGAPVTLALRASPERMRRQYLIPLVESRLARVLTYPLVALGLFVAALWVWHLPVAYEAAIENDMLHAFEHISFLAGAMLFWWLVVAVDATRLRPGHVGRIALLIAALLQNIALALILTSLSEPAYDVYVDVMRDWGPSALTDQRIGGGVMWVPGAMMFFFAILVTVYYWAEREQFNGRRGDMIRDLERRAGESESRGG